MPGAAAGRGASSSTAFANARYGFAVRSMAHGAASAFSPRITADAAVARRCAPYLGLTKKVRSPGCACSMPATRWISISPSPSSRHSSCAAISRSFTGGSIQVRASRIANRASRLRSRRPLEEVREVLQPERRRDRVARDRRGRRALRGSSSAAKTARSSPPRSTSRGAGPDGRRAARSSAPRCGTRSSSRGNSGPGTRIRSAEMAAPTRSTHSQNRCFSQSRVSDRLSNWRACASVTSSG